MRLFKIIILAIFFVSSTGAANTSASSISNGGIKKRLNYIKGEILVKYKKGVTEESIKGFHNKMYAIKKMDIPRLGIHNLMLSDWMSVEDAVSKFKENPDVEYAEPNYILRAFNFPSDASFLNLWGLHNIGQSVNGTAGTNDADIDAPEAWDITTGSSNVVIAVIDTGIAYNHADLNSNIWSNSGETSCTDGIDNDGNGYIDDCRGWDFIDNDNNPTDYNTHGTHVAGTIAAIGNNSSGITGVMWTAKIMPLRFLGVSGAGDTASAVSAIIYAANNGARIINASWGGGDYSQTLYNAISYARDRGVLLVAAAGNEGSDNDSSPLYPASFSLDNIISVAATDQNDNLAYFSNYGSASVDLGAPGYNIYSSIPSLSYGTATTLYSVNFDADTAGNLPSGWSRGGTNSTWAVTNSSSSSTPNSLTDSPSGNYSDNTYSWAYYGTQITSTKNYLYTVSFNARYTLENNYDYLLLVGSNTGANNSSDWYVLDYWTGTQSSFTAISSQEVTQMSDLYSSFYFGFGLYSDININYDGAYIDNVQLTSQPITISSDSYAYYSGTSMAAPHVAGVAGLVISANPFLTYSQVKDIIISSVDKKSSLSGKTLSGGRLNAYSSVIGVFFPSAPSNLSATAVSSSQIDLSWTDVSANETGFSIERKDNASGAYSEIATVRAGVTTYPDAGVSSGTTYYYRVKAYNVVGSSPYSNEANATTESSSDDDGGCGFVKDYKGDQPPIAGMLILLLPVVWLVLRKMAAR